MFRSISQAHLTTECFHHPLHISDVPHNLFQNILMNTLTSLGSKGFMFWQQARRGLLKEAQDTELTPNSARGTRAQLLGSRPL